MRSLIFVFVTVLFFSPFPLNAQPRIKSPFFAMDTCTKRPYPRNDIPPAAQLDLIKDLGYAGIAWTEEDPKQVKRVAEQAKERGLKMFSIYCGARVSPKGISYSSRLKPIIKALAGHGTIIWLHIGGKGPSFTTLRKEHPAVKDLQTLADFADKAGLKIAIYPHVGEWTERIQNAVKVAKVVDRKNFGVCFNLCHCLAVGDEKKIPALLEKAAPHLFIVTINGADSGVKGPIWRRLIQNLDQGTYDVGIILQKLQEIQFQGPIGLQGYGVGGDRRANLAASMNGWRKLKAKLTK